MVHPIIATRGSTKAFVHIFTAKTPATAESLLNRKIEAATRAAKIPSPGKIPRNIPSAAPPATFSGVSLIRKKRLLKFLNFFHTLFF